MVVSQKLKMEPLCDAQRDWSQYTTEILKHPYLLWNYLQYQSYWSAKMLPVMLQAQVFWILYSVGGAVLERL